MTVHIDEMIDYGHPFPESHVRAFLRNDRGTTSTNAYVEKINEILSVVNYVMRNQNPSTYTEFSGNDPCTDGLMYTTFEEKSISFDDVLDLVEELPGPNMVDFHRDAVKRIHTEFVWDNVYSLPTSQIGHECIVVEDPRDRPDSTRTLPIRHWSQSSYIAP